MNYRKFGKTDLEVSEVGFGAWAIGGSAIAGEIPIGWGATDDNVSKQAIHAALDAGITFFDTADIYGLGHSEDLLGKILHNQKNVVIATKVGNVVRNNKFSVDYSQEYMISACEASLRRLKRDVIDYYQLHTARLAHLEDQECIHAMQLLRKQGKVRYWGLSLNTFQPAPEAEYLMENKIGDGFQLVFNVINQKAFGLMKQAAANEYGIIARMPLQFGLLSGKIRADTQFEKGDHRSFRLTPEVLRSTISFLEKKVWPLAEKQKMSNAQLALSFILSCSEVSTVIPGLRTPGHVAENTTGLQRLSEDVYHDLLNLQQDEELQELLALIEKAG